MREQQRGQAPLPNLFFPNPHNFHDDTTSQEAPAAASLRLLRESGLNTSQRAQGRSATGRTGEHQSDDRRADLSAQMQAIKIAAPDIIVAPGRIEKGGKFTLRHQG